MSVLFTGGERRSEERQSEREGGSAGQTDTKQ